MAHLFRNNENKRLYFIEHVFNNYKLIDGGASQGIYAYPFQWEGETIKHTVGMTTWIGKEYNPIKFVKDNFEIVAELYQPV